jgi:hypothetical protein
MTRWLAAVALVLAAVAWPFAGPLFAGRVLYFRDVGVTYYPDLVFLSRALAQGVWPLWHPGADAGAPFLAAYPVHLLLAGVAGPRVALALSPPLHVLLATVGAFLLARRLGASPSGAVLSGLVFGLSGAMLGSVLYPVFLAAAWAPLAVALALSLEEPRPWGRAAALALVVALQVSTLGVEALPQTALAVLVLTPRRPSGRAVRALLAAVFAAALLAAPVVLGSLAMLAGSARGRGFPPAVAMSYSAPPAVLLEALVPRFLGDPHSFSEVGFWGQPFFAGAGPFFLSLYLGPVVLLLAAGAGRRGARLWILAGVGILLALGSFGPLGPVLVRLMGPMRAPVKFFVTATLAIALLSGLGLDRAAGRAGSVRPRRRRWGAVGPGLAFLVLAAIVRRWPAGVAGGLCFLFPAASRDLVLDVVARLWPLELAATGAASLGAGLAVAQGGRVAVLAGVLAVTDLLRVNGGLSPAAPGDFYSLRPGMRAAVAQTQPAGRYRFFSYGAAYAETLRWRPQITRTGRDVWLYLVDRQALVPRTQVIDGLEGALDVDRMGLAPEGATVDVAEMRASRFAALRGRLRLANVRWVLSFDPIDDAAVALRRTISFPEVVEPLRLYEMRQPLPRAFFVPEAEVEPSADARRKRLEEGTFDPFRSVVLDTPPPSGRPALPLVGAGRPPPAGASPRVAPDVTYELLDPHTVRVRATTPAGFIVVLDGYHPDWTAWDETGAAVPVLRADGRYRAMPTSGGVHVFTLRYRPSWRASALLALSAGILAVVALAGAGGAVSEFTALRGTRRANLRSKAGH